MEGTLASIRSSNEVVEIGRKTGSIRILRIDTLAGATFLLFLALSLCGTFIVHSTDHAGLRQIAELFMFEEERNLPTLFNFILLLMNGAALGTVAMFAFGGNDWWRWHWTFLALLFLLLAYDEAAQVHEGVGKVMETLVDAGGYLTFAWVIPGAAVALLVGLAFRRFLFALPRRSATLFVLAGVLYVGGAIGVEMLEANHYSSNGFDMAFSLLATVEESLEMTALIVLLHATLALLAGVDGVLQFELKNVGRKQP